MKALFINTSTKNIVVSIVVDNDIKFLYKNVNKRDLASVLMPTIDDAFNKVGITPRDIDTIFVTVGPGSFTGIRVGLTVAKVMAWGLNIKVVPISSLEFMASISNNNKNVLSLIDARRDYVYAGVYDSNLDIVVEDSYISLDDLRKKVSDKDLYYVSEDEFSFEVNEPGYDVLKIINKHKDDDGINPHLLKPNYLKNTEAEEKLNGSRC